MTDSGNEKDNSGSQQLSDFWIKCKKSTEWYPDNLLY